MKTSRWNPAWRADERRGVVLPGGRVLAWDALDPAAKGLAGLARTARGHGNTGRAAEFDDLLGGLVQEHLDQAAAEAASTVTYRGTLDVPSVYNHSQAVQVRAVVAGDGRRRVELRLDKSGTPVELTTADQLDAVRAELDRALKAAARAVWDSGQPAHDPSRRVYKRELDAAPVRVDGYAGTGPGTGVGHDSCVVLFLNDSENVSTASGDATVSTARWLRTALRAASDSLDWT